MVSTERLGEELHRAQRINASSVWEFCCRPLVVVVKGDELGETPDDVEVR